MKHKPNIIDKDGNDCIHMTSSGLFANEVDYFCNCSLPDCVPDIKWFYIDHEDLDSLSEGETLSRIIWFCRTHKCEV